MSWKSDIRLTCAIALPVCLLLSACGGDGTTNVASIPPPPVTPTPTPTPTSSLDVKVTPLSLQGTQAGTYDLLGRVISTPAGAASTSRILAAGEASLTIGKQNDILSFTVNGPALPAGGTSFASPEVFWSQTLSDPTQISESGPGGRWPQFLGQRMSAYRIRNDGSEELSVWYDFLRGYSTSAATGSALTYNVGNNYVAMGEWSSSVITPGRMPSMDLLFVNGERTLSSGIPISGTATYGAHTLSLLSPCYDSGCPGIYFQLTADFALRTIATRIDQDYQHYTDFMAYGEPAIRNAGVLGIHVGGSAPFSNDGYFEIPLAGTVNYSATNVLTTPPTEPVTGSMNGAFFGPHAEEIGGTLSLDRASGPPIKDAFIGHRGTP